MMFIFANLTINISYSAFGSHMTHSITSATRGWFLLLQAILSNMTWFTTGKAGTFNHIYFQLSQSYVGHPLSKLQHYISEVNEGEWNRDLIRSN